MDFATSPLRPKAVYDTKQSDGLRARGYDSVVFNATSSDKDDVRKWMTDNSGVVMDIVSLSKDDSDVHMFKVKVHYKDKNTVLSSDFCPEFVCCRRKFIVRIQTPIMTNLLHSDIQL